MQTLIKHDININEGMELIDSALEIEPEIKKKALPKKVVTKPKKKKKMPEGGC